MDQYMKEVFNQMKSMDLVFTNGLTGKFMKDNGKITWWMAKDIWDGQTEKNI